MGVSGIVDQGRHGRARAFRLHALLTVGAGALCFDGAASAQAPAPIPEPPSTTSGPVKSANPSTETVNVPGGRDQPPTDPISGEPAPPPGDEITVTGTRIVRDGYSAPTPVSVISTEELNREAPANISDFVNTLPAVRGSTTAASSNGSLSNGLAGVATVNLRNLGASRTLVLIDGQRSVPSATTGVVDVNTVPQSLIERVEVVTGGASSAYGSDAVSGVLNFILDKDFQGLKGEYEYGVTTFGDGANHKASLTAGTAFGGDRGHVILSGEYFTQKEIDSIDRDWNRSGFFQIDNPAYSAAACTDNNAATACVPGRLVQGGIGTGTFSPGGLIVSGPLRGSYFGTINPATGRASVNQLVFGPQSGQWMIGGDYPIASEGHVSSATLLPSEERISAFGRLSWEFSPAFNVFGQFSYAYYRGESFYQQTPTTPVTIQRDNAFLPDSIRAQMTTLNLATIQIGTSNIGIPPQGSDNKREVYRYVAGADGGFAALGREWRWDAYYQFGQTKTDELLTNAWNIQRMANATDAVVSGGSIACRINVDANPNNNDPACVPLNRIGLGGMSPAAVDYVLYNGLQPLREQKLEQEVAALNFSTNDLFELPAGPVSIAFGAEYRKESVTGTVDPLFRPTVTNGVTIGTWIYGNFLPTIGDYNVKEAYLEAIVPIFEGLDFNGAVRVTDYSTSGQVETWKAGLTWQPIEDVRLRGTVSRDIRAPNLGELFAPGTGRTNTVNVPQPGGALRADQFNESTVGNADLLPEVAETYGVGVVVTPTFLPGFAASIDFFDIKVDGSIANIGAQTLVDQCYLQSIASACEFISTTAGRGVTTPGLAVTSIEIKPLNFVSVEARGIDFEASYRRPVGPGTVQLRALVSHALRLYTNNGIDVPTQSAGQNTGSLPDWTYRLSAGYNMDNGFSFQFVGRGLSSGTYDNSYIVCSTDCPVSTVANRTVNTNRVAGAFYLDFNADYDFTVRGVRAAAFISIRNVLNEDPVLVGNGPTGNNTPAYPQTTRTLYDVLGRVFRLGARFAL